MKKSNFSSFFLNCNKNCSFFLGHSILIWKTITRCLLSPRHIPPDIFFRHIFFFARFFLLFARYFFLSAIFFCQKTLNRAKELHHSSPLQELEKSHQWFGNLSSILKSYRSSGTDVFRSCVVVVKQRIFSSYSI